MVKYHRKHPNLSGRFRSTYYYGKSHVVGCSSSPVHGEHGLRMISK